MLMEISIVCCLLCLVTLTFGAQCPQGTIHYGDRNECIDAVDAKTTYAGAQLLCTQVNGRLIQIQDIFENVVTGTQAGQAIANNSHSYIGVQQQNGNWVYGDGSPLIYQNWKSGHPLSNMSCAVISAKDYQWTSVDCASSHSFICSIPDQTPIQTTTTRVFTAATRAPSTIVPPTFTPPPFGCPDGWVTYRQNCYYFAGSANSTNVTYYYKDGEQFCQQMGSHLVSIHSQLEADFLQRTIATNSSTIDCHANQAMIGLTCVEVGRNKTWTWSDGSRFDFDETQTFCADVYGIINDPKCYEHGYWDPWGGTMSFSRFICKMKEN